MLTRMFYDNLNSALEQRHPLGGTVIVSDDFNALTRNEIAGYKLSIGSLGPGIRSSNNFLLEFSGYRRLRMLVLGRRNQNCTAEYDIAMLDG